MTEFTARGHRDVQYVFKYDDKQFILSITQTDRTAPVINIPSYTFTIHNLERINEFIGIAVEDFKANHQIKERKND